MWWKRKKKSRNEHVEKSDEDIDYEKLQEGLELLLLVAEFEKRYWECPPVTRFSGMRKARRWRREVNIFRAGYKVGMEWARKSIINSGWLKKDIQEELERKEKSEESG